MATPITSLDSANIVSSVNNVTLNITGSKVDQQDFDYILGNRYEFTGSVMDANTISFGYGVLQPPTSSYMTYSFAGGVTTEADFDFHVNGIKVVASEILSFNQNFTNTETTISLNLPYALIPSDTITGKGRWNV